MAFFSFFSCSFLFNCLVIFKIMYRNLKAAISEKPVDKSYKIRLIAFGVKGL